MEKLHLRNALRVVDIGSFSSPNFPATRGHFLFHTPVRPQLRRWIEVKTVDDGKGTTTYTYDGTDSRGRVEHRGLVTKLDAGLPSGIPDEFTGSYDGDGQLIEQKSPGGVAATWVYDATGAETALNYTFNGNPLLGWARHVDVRSRTSYRQSSASAQVYGYDDRDRLIDVADASGGSCISRKYTLSGDSNRTSLKTYAPAAGGGCQNTTATATVNSDFDGADRITTAGYTYDPLGRTKTVPAADTGTVGGGTLSVGYHANDMVATMSQDVTTAGATVTKGQDYTLDASDRLSVTKNLTGGVSLTESTNHYDDGSDSPAWTATKTRPNASTTWTDSWTRNITGLDGNLALWQQSDGYIFTQHTNLHDDVAFLGVLGPTGIVAVASYSEYTEYGLSKDPASRPARYGWLGGKQRDNSAIGGLTLMGARLYNPVTGRFLSRDPVPGGNDNSYIYPPDPINQFDLDGRISATRKKSKAKVNLSGRSIMHVVKDHNVGLDAARRAIRYGVDKGERSSKGIDRRFYSYRIYQYEKDGVTPTGRWAQLKVLIEWGDKKTGHGELITAWSEYDSEKPFGRKRNGKDWAPDWVRENPVLGKPHNGG